MGLRLESWWGAGCKICTTCPACNGASVCKGYCGRQQLGRGYSWIIVGRKSQHYLPAAEQASAKAAADCSLDSTKSFGGVLDAMAAVVACVFGSVLWVRQALVYHFLTYCAVLLAPHAHAPCLHLALLLAPHMHLAPSVHL